MEDFEKGVKFHESVATIEDKSFDLYRYIAKKKNTTRWTVKSVLHPFFIVRVLENLNLAV